jgi:hypothetical protein
MVLIYQPPNAHVRISWILLRNAMAATAVKKIYRLGNISADMAAHWFDEDLFVIIMIMTWMKKLDKMHVMCARFDFGWCQVGESDVI